MRSEEVAQLMLIHALGKVGDVEVGVLLVRESLELRVEGLLQECQCEQSATARWMEVLTLAKLTS